MINEGIDIENDLHRCLDVSSTPRLDDIPFGLLPSRKASTATVGIVDALQTLPFELPSSMRVTYASDILRHPNENRHQARRTLSRSFSGVEAKALPVGLDDVIDVIEVPCVTVAADAGSRRSSLPNLSPDLPNEVELTRRQRQADRVAIQEALQVLREKETML
jgi:hypothetical protein